MKPLSRARGIPPLTQAKVTGIPWHTLLDAISKPDFIMIVVFCTIGLLTMLNVTQRFPDFGAVIEEYNQF
jgi:hypothetical protein